MFRAKQEAVDPVWIIFLCKSFQASGLVALSFSPCIEKLRTPRLGLPLYDGLMSPGQTNQMRRWNLLPYQISFFAPDVESIENIQMKLQLFLLIIALLRGVVKKHQDKALKSG